MGNLSIVFDNGDCIECSFTSLGLHMIVEKGSARMAGSHLPKMDAAIVPGGVLTVLMRRASQVLHLALIV